MFNRNAVYLRAHCTQVGEGYNAGWERRVARYKGELRYLKATVGKKEK